MHSVHEIHRSAVGLPLSDHGTPSEQPRFSVERLRRTLADLNPTWTEPSSFRESGVHHRYSTTNAGVQQAFAWVLRAFMPVRMAHLGRLAPGGFIVPHVDAGPHYERWHVPIYAAGTWGREHHPQDGMAFRVEHWKVHHVWNPTDQDRIHLLVDRAIRVTHELTPQTLYLNQVPIEYREAVKAVHHGA